MIQHSRGVANSHPGKENSMTTKEQERKALEKITTIIAEVGGEESYIGAAFDGCFEIAQDNIENDFMCSWKQRYERACEEADKARGEASEMFKSYELANKNLVEVTQKLTEANRAFSGLQEKYDELQYKYIEQAQGAQAKDKDLQEQLEAAQLEIIKLKAKLYDYMIS